MGFPVSYRTQTIDENRSSYTVQCQVVIGVTNKKAGQRQRMMEMVLGNVVRECFYEEMVFE